MTRTYGVMLLLQVAAEGEQSATIELTADTLKVIGERSDIQRLALEACDAAFEVVSQVMKAGPGRSKTHGQG